MRSYKYRLFSFVLQSFLCVRIKIYHLWCFMILFMCSHKKGRKMQSKIKVRSINQLGAISKLVRQSQSLDQETAGLLSGNGLTFISQFENGKETVEIGRVLNLLEQLGIELDINLPPNLPEKTITKLKKMDIG